MNPVPLFNHYYLTNLPPLTLLLLLLLLQVHVIWGWLLWWWTLSPILQIRRVLAVGHNSRVHTSPVIDSIVSLAATARSSESTPAHVLLLLMLLLLLHERQHFTATALVPGSHATSESTRIVVAIKASSVIIIHVIKAWRGHTRSHRSTLHLHLVALWRCLLLLCLLLLLLLALHRLTFNQLGQTLLCLEEWIES